MDPDMVSDVEVLMIIDDHYRRCADALRRIAALGDSDSKGFKQTFGQYPDDRSEEWCELHWKRGEDASDGGE